MGYIVKFKGGPKDGQVEVQPVNPGPTIYIPVIDGAPFPSQTYARRAGATLSVPGYREVAYRKEYDLIESYGDFKTTSSGRWPVGGTYVYQEPPKVRKNPVLDNLQQKLRHAKGLVEQIEKELARAIARRDIQ